MAKIIKSMQIEEIVLAGIALFFLILSFSLGFSANNAGLIFKKGLSNIIFSFEWLLNGIILGVGLLIAKNFREKNKDFLKQIMLLSKTTAIIALTAVLGISTIGILQQKTGNGLINLQLLNADKFLTKKYLLFWLHSPSNGLNDFFHFLTPAMIYSFLSLATVMGLLAFILYFEKNKNLFKGYIMSMFIVFALAMPFWGLFPANSPANYFLHDPGLDFNADLSEAIGNYRPDERTAAFQERMWQEQKNAPPISTMPSMHWAWSIIIVYYLFKKERKTIVFSSAWLAFDLSGTIYLGNHYLIDGLVAVPLAILSLFLANLFIKLKRE